MSARNLSMYSKYYRNSLSSHRHCLHNYYQHQQYNFFHTRILSNKIALHTNNRHSLNSLSLTFTSQRFLDSRGKLIVEPGIDAPGKFGESMDAGEWKRRKVAQFGSDYAYPGWRPWPYIRNEYKWYNPEEWNITGKTYIWWMLFGVFFAYNYYIRKKQKLWMRTDHPEYYANHPMKKKEIAKQKAKEEEAAAAAAAANGSDSENEESE